MTSSNAFKTEVFTHEGPDGLPLERALKDRYAASWSRVRDLVASGKVFVEDQPCKDGRRLLEEGARVRIQMNAPREKPGFVNAQELVRFHDRDLVVVHKPVGLSSMTHEGEPDSMDRQVQRWLEQKLGRRRVAVHVVHRLDKVTSGIMVFALNRETMLALKEQFRAHEVGRSYQAIAHGAVTPGRLEFRIVRDRGDGLRGVSREPRAGVHSVTNIEVRERLERCTFLICRLETGRTHQIRIHLAETGHPLVGEPLYTNPQYTGSFRGPWLGASRVMLHAATLSFEHPRTRARLSFEAETPEEFERFLERERRRQT